MSLHAFSAAAPTLTPLCAEYAFDSRLTPEQRAVLDGMLNTLAHRGILSQMASCCCFSAELVAGLLRRNRIPADVVACRVTLRAPEGIAYLGQGFARPGQIDSHFAVVTETMLVDWGLGAARSLPALRHLPLGLVVPHAPGPLTRVESAAGGYGVIWEAVSPGPAVSRLQMAEKIKAARVLNQIGQPRRRLSCL